MCLGGLTTFAADGGPERRPHRNSGETLALKKLLRMDLKSVTRLKQEFRALADLHHPNLIKLYDLGRTEDAWYITMEYLDGVDLISHLAQVTTRTSIVANRNAEPELLNLARI